jgi:hypothetical protein
MLADLPPRAPRPDKGLSDKIFGKLAVLHAGQHRPQADAAGDLVRLGVVFSHTQLTLQRRYPFTCNPS